jgi:superfamily II DNA or RNA helicase
MMTEIARPYRSPLVIVPRVALIVQTELAFASEGMHVTATTIQGLITKEGIGAHDIVFYDEARHYVADKWRRAVDMVPKHVLRAGFDATPERADGRGLAGAYDEIVEAISIRDAIAEGFLVPCKVIRPKHSHAPGSIAAHPIDAYEEHANGQAAVVYASTIDVGEEYLAAALARGHRATIVHSRVQVEGTNDNRDELVRRMMSFNEGNHDILINVSMLTEGWDSPRVSCVIMGTSVSSAGGMLQRVGRGLRPFPGKERCTFIDLAGVTHIHGTPDEDREWALRGIASVLPGKGPRFCPACGAQSEAQEECSKCGHKGEMRRRKPRVTGEALSAQHERDKMLPDEDVAIALSRLRTVGFIRRWHPRKADRICESKFQRPISSRIEALSKCVVRRGSQYEISEEKRMKLGI